MTEPPTSDLARALLDSVAEHFPDGTPRLSALVKPPGGAAERVSPFTFVRLEDDTLGVCWNLLDDDDQRAGYDALAEADYVGRPAGELAELLLAPGRPQRILGYACLNALSQRLLRDGKLTARADLDLVGMMKLGPEDHVGLVGFAPPLVRDLSRAAGRVTVLEKERKRAGKQENVRIRTAPEALADCNKVLITSTTLLNDSFAELDRVTRGATFRALYGPGAGVFPAVFFARGYHALAGLRVLDPDTLLQRQADGKKWKDAKEKCVFVP